MKNIKTYEGYLSDKMKVIKDKFNKLKNLVDFIEKYQLQHFGISAESPNFLFEYIVKEEDGFYIEYESYDSNNKSKSNKVELTELSNDVIDELLDLCENDDILDIERHMEMGLSNIQEWERILKNHKEPIKFSEWMFGMILENDYQKDANTFKFQDLLFKTHPEAFVAFMDECIDSQERTTGFEALRIAQGIEKKYKSLFDDYKTLKDSEKYNI